MKTVILKSAKKKSATVSKAKIRAAVSAVYSGATEKSYTTPSKVIRILKKAS